MKLEAESFTQPIENMNILPIIATHKSKTTFLLLGFLFTIFSNPILAQRKRGPSPEAVELAKSLRDKYEDEKAVTIKRIDEYLFSLDDSKKKVIVAEKIEETIIGISSLNAEIPRFKFYDEQSEIPEISAFNEQGKKKYISISDDYYQSEDIFYSDAKLKFFTLNFYGLGEKYRVVYQKNYLDIKYFTSVYFNDILNIENRTVRFVVPKWLNLELKEMNFEGSGIKLNKTFDSQRNADVYEYTAAAIPQVAREESAPGKSHIYPHLLILAKSFSHQGKETVLFKSVADLYGWYHSLTELMENESDGLKGKVAELTEGKTSDLDKVKAIYYWVQDNIRYIAFEDGLAGFKPDECQFVYEKRYGDCKGMANLTKEMLLLAGFDARLTWIGTDRIAYDYSTPNLAVDNHMICTLILDGKEYFLDPTDKYSSFDDYAERLQNRQVLIENGDNFILSNVPNREAQNNTRQINSKFKIEGDILKGDVNRIYKGESRAYLLYQINYTETDALSESLRNFISRGDKNVKVSDLETSDFEERDQLFTLDYHLDIKNAAYAFDNEIYLDIDQYKELEGFQIEERKLDYKFPYKTHILINTEVEIPAGYGVNQLPESLNEEHGSFSASISYRKEGNTLYYTKEILIKESVLKSEDFEAWNQFVGNIKSKYEEQIVLTKKS